MTIYNFPFDLIDAFTREVLPYCVSGITTWREEISSALVVYSLRDLELGDLGTVRLRKLINGGTEIIFTYPPSPDDFEIYRMTQHRIEQKQIGKTLPEPVKEILSLEQLKQLRNLAKIHFTNLKETRKREVMEAYMSRLNQEQMELPAQENSGAEQQEESELPISVQPTSDLHPNTINKKRLIDQACVDWAGRGYLPHNNQSEFLQNFEAISDIYLTVDQFKDALKDAGKRGLIVKINKRWRLPGYSPLKRP